MMNSEQSDDLLKKFAKGRSGKVFAEIVKASPRQGFEMLRFLSGPSNRDTELLDDLQTGSDVAAALSAWDDYSAAKDKEVREAYKKSGGLMLGEPEETHQAKLKVISEYHRTRHPRNQAQVQMLIAHWKALDPDEFKNSTYREWEKKTK